MSEVFSVILADPPWRYQYARTNSRRVENHYPTMTEEELLALDVRALAAPEAILFLWSTSPKLDVAMRVIPAWGFQYKTCAVWVKLQFGMGYYFRQQHELLLVCTRGKMRTPPPAARPSSVVYASRRKHSQKPVEVHEIIERMYPMDPKLELFARQPREGWSVWGSEVESKITVGAA